MLQYLLFQVDLLQKMEHNQLQLQLLKMKAAPTINFSNSAQVLQKIAGSSLTLTATSSIAADEDITVSIQQAEQVLKERL